MGMSPAYGEADRGEAVATVHAALDAGITLLDTGDFYGMGHNEMLLAEALRSRPRDAYQLSVKFGAQVGPDGSFAGFDGRPAAVKTAAAYSLRRLGTDNIDVYRPAAPRSRRRPSRTPSAQSVSSSTRDTSGISACRRWASKPFVAPHQYGRSATCRSSTHSCHAASRTASSTPAANSASV